jgi:hypothetical protein
LSIFPMVNENVGTNQESAREWNVKLVCKSEQARFSDLFRNRENISRATFLPDLDNDKHGLLFRVYVPSGRLYAAETDRLLTLFQDWLNSAGRRGVRLDRRSTSAGQVYEFLAGETPDRQELSREFMDFSKFLTMCADASAAAVATLTRTGMNGHLAEAMVARYGKEVRRLQLDLRQERESKLLSIRHSLESELLDIPMSFQQWDQVNQYIEDIVPNAATLAPMPLLSLSNETSSKVTVNINQQVIRAVNSTVIQSVKGTINLGVQAKELLELVSQFGAQEATALESAVHEFEDPDAPPSSRLQAKRRLKVFLIQLAGQIEDVALMTLEKYLETKLGK